MARTKPPQKPVRKKPAVAPDLVLPDTPLEYMLRVMRDPAVEPARRDEMAKLALPYVHAKPTAIEHTGKDGGPIEISDISPSDIARRLGFVVEQGKAE
jgi:hypothetical protein